MTAPPRFSVLLPAEDLRGEILGHLSSWLHQDFDPAQYEIIWVGHASGRDLSPVRAALRPHDTLLTVEGLSEMEEMALAATHARGEFLVFTEGHVAAEPDCLSALDVALAERDLDGALCRSLPAEMDRPIHRFEERMYHEIIPQWGPSRMFSVRGCAVRRIAYHAAGGLPAGYDLFAEPCLAARLHENGSRIEWVPAAGIRHSNSVSFADLREDVAGFASGEIRYRAHSGDDARCNRLFGQSPYWNRRLAARSGIGRRLWLALAVRLASDLRMQRLRAPRAAARARLLAATAPAAFGGLRAELLLARVRARFEQFRLDHSRASDDRLYPLFVHYWSETLVRLGQLRELVALGPAAQTEPESAQVVPLAEVSSGLITGFGPVEEANGRRFRWSTAAAAALVRIPSGATRVRLCVLPGAVTPAAFTATLARRRLAFAEAAPGALEAPLPPGLSGVAALILAATPFRAPGDPRLLGVPLVAIEFA